MPHAIEERFGRCIGPVLGLSYPIAGVAVVMTLFKCGWPLANYLDLWLQLPSRMLPDVGTLTLFILKLLVGGPN